MVNDGGSGTHTHTHTNRPDWVTDDAVAIRHNRRDYSYIFADAWFPNSTQYSASQNIVFCFFFLFLPSFSAVILFQSRHDFVAKYHGYCCYCCRCCYCWYTDCCDGCYVVQMYIVYDEQTHKVTQSGAKYVQCVHLCVYMGDVRVELLSFFFSFYSNVFFFLVFFSLLFSRRVQHRVTTSSAKCTKDLDELRAQSISFSGRHV